MIDFGEEGDDGEGDWNRTGCLEEATVLGLRSWRGSGFLLSDADCMVEAISIGSEEVIVDT